MAIRITCINKSGGRHDDPHHAISHVAWKNEETGATGRNSRVEIYDWIKDKNGTAYVRDARGNQVNVRTRQHANGTKFLQTYADGIWTDNLLALPECR